MSSEAFLFLGILATAWGLDEYLPAKTRFPIKLAVGIGCIIIAVLMIFGVRGLTK